MWLQQSVNCSGASRLKRHFSNTSSGRTLAVTYDAAASRQLSAGVDTKHNPVSGNGAVATTNEIERAAKSACTEPHNLHAKGGGREGCI